MQMLLRFGTQEARINPQMPRVTIGTDAQRCQLVVNDPSVGAMHAEVYLEGEVFHIRDLNSSCSTLIDGVRLHAMSMPLRPGQSVNLGRQVLITQLEQGPAPQYGAPQYVMPPQYGAPPPGYGPPGYPPPGYPAPPPPGYGAPAYPPQPGYPPQAPYGQPPPGYPPQAPPGYPQAAPPGYPQPPPPGYPQPPPQPQYAQYGAPPAAPGYPAPPAAAPPAPVAPAVAIAAAAPDGSPASLRSAQIEAQGNSPLGVGGATAPKPADCAYRRQSSNNNGVLLVALPKDTYANGAMVEGFLEFTSTDNEKVSSIFVELIEHHKDGPSAGHVWDKVLVRQGPWETKKGEVAAMPFALRVPPGTSITGPKVFWQLRGYVDISWGYDLETLVDINMRNVDIERIRDALGSLDYRIVELDPKPLGQKFVGKFQPPTQLRSQLGISDINLDVEYLGSNLKMVLEVEKTSLFKFDKRHEIVFELAKLRTAQLPELSNYLQQQINVMMGK